MKTILLVEPDQRVRTLLRAVFADSYALQEAASGSEALGMMGQDQPALVVLEVWLPDMCGIELCRLIKEGQGSPVRVVFLTTDMRPEIQARALGAGADAYITKPFSPAELLGQVGRLLNGPRSDSAPAAD